MKVSPVFLLAILAGLWVADASLSFSPVVVVKEHGRKLWYCGYKGLEVLPRTRIIDRKGCMFCTCTRNGLHCSTMVPTFHYPEESLCMPIAIRCKRVVWVLKKNPLRLCPDDMMPKEIVATGK